MATSASTARPAARFHDSGRRSAKSSRLGSPIMIRSRTPSMRPNWTTTAIDDVHWYAMSSGGSSVANLPA
jgi:hypothetical protein